MTDKKYERVKMKLSRDAVIAFKESKRKLYGNPELPVSDGFVLGMAYSDLCSEIYKFDWGTVNDMDIPNVTGSNDLATSINTTLTIEPSVYEGLKQLQSYLKNEYGGRVHFSYVVKLVLFLFLIEDTKRPKIN